MSKIDNPGIRWELFTKLNAELTTFRPDIAAEQKILCPVCGRALPFDAFSLEHILPQRLLKKDPLNAQTISKNKRAGLTLLCKKNLIMTNSKTLNGGCNQWKGKMYDQKLEAFFEGSKTLSGIHEAFFATAYLALFSAYGYRVAFTEAGNVSRFQFLNPQKRLLRRLPFMSNTILGFDYEDWKKWDKWDEPFSFGEEELSEGLMCVVTIRGKATALPLSHPLSLAFNSPLIIPSRKKILRPVFNAYFA